LADRKGIWPVKSTARKFPKVYPGDWPNLKSNFGKWAAETKL